MRFTPWCERVFLLPLMLLISAYPCASQRANSGTLRGKVADAFGGVIVGASITLSSANAAEKKMTSNDEGRFQFDGLSAGTYVVRVSAAGFAIYENRVVEITDGRVKTLDVQLEVTIEKQVVTIPTESGLSTSSDNKADAINIQGRDLEVLPDDPDALMAAVQAMASASGGPNGGQIFIDGFAGGRMPPKETIREIRVTQNVFNAEYDRFGMGRVDILTKPGTGKLHGSSLLLFNDEAFNARNPFARFRAPFQARLFGASLSGPIVAKKSSFFLDFQWRDTDANSIVNSIIVNPNLIVTPFVQTALTPQRFVTFSPRLDFQLNKNNTLTVRYAFTRSTFHNEGIGDFSLPQQAFFRSNTEHLIQLSETAIINPQLINETRFQFVHSQAARTSDNSLPAINVVDSFIGGNSQVGKSSASANNWELQNYSTLTTGRQILRFGVRLHQISIDDISTQNFGGTFTFTGGTAPVLDAQNQIVIDPLTGNPQLAPISSIERYRRTLLFPGLPALDRIALGAVPTQFTIAGGEPRASVNQFDIGAFFQDEWRPSPTFTLSLGMRFEAQNNISKKFAFAPRLFLAWAPGRNKTGPGAPPPKFVIRVGAGIFYDRFSESGTLNANRFNGITQQRFVVTAADVLSNPAFSLAGVTNVPTLSQLAGFAQPQIAFRRAPDLRAPYSIMSSINFERQLPHKFTVFGVVFNYRTRHAFRLRNINAPLPGTFDPSRGVAGVRPLGNVGDIYQYESTGNFNDYRTIFGVRNQLSKSFSLYANMLIGRSRSDTECVLGVFADCFPADSYNLQNDVGPLGSLNRRSFFMGGTFNLPVGKIVVSPLIIASTGRPFNIITGRDTNGDGVYTERPAFATSSTKPENLRQTRFGNFDLNPLPGQPMIPRNLGEGPAIFAVNLNISRTFGFGGSASPATPERSPTGGAATRSAAPREFPYHLTFGVQIQNLLNRANLAPPVGNLSSPFFGQSVGTTWTFGLGSPSASNRRIDFQLRFSF